MRWREGPAIQARHLNFWRARASGMALYTQTEIDDAARLQREASRLEAGARRESRKRPAPDTDQGLVTDFATPDGAHPPESTPMKSPARPQGPPTLATAGVRRRRRRPQARAGRVARAAAVLAGLQALRGPARAPVVAAAADKPADGGGGRRQGCILPLQKRCGSSPRRKRAGSGASMTRTAPPLKQLGQQNRGRLVVPGHEPGRQGQGLATRPCIQRAPDRNFRGWDVEDLVLEPHMN